MKSNNRLRCFTQIGVALVLAALATLTARAQITWGAAQNITGDSDVVTAGTLLYAYDYNYQNETVNGVPFTGILGNTAPHVGSTLTSSHTNTYFSGTWNSTLSAAYTNILVGAIYLSSSAAQTVTFSNLTSGHSYLVQFWVNDPRNPTRTDTLSTTGGNSVLLKFGVASGAPGQFAVGLFTAAGTTQTLTVVGTTGTVPSLNAVQVRDVTGLNTWGGYQSGTWDYTSTNWGIGQSFATVTNIYPQVAFTDTNAQGSEVTANVVSVQPAGVSIGAVNFANNLVHYTLQSSAGTLGISGATAVNVLGSGTVTFTGPNTYTGATTIGSGTLALGAGGSISNSVIVLNGGTLNVAAVGSFDLGGGGSSSNYVTFAGGGLVASGLTVDGAALSFAASAAHPSITAATLTYGAPSSVTVAPVPSQSSYPVQYPLVKYTAIGGGAFNLDLNALPYGYAGYLSNNVANNSIDLVLTSGLVTGSSSLYWDPALASGPSDGAGNWSSTVANWWNGVQTVPWTNNSGVAVLGVNTATAYTATITNSVTVGGLVFANSGAGAYTIGTSGGSVLTFSGSSPAITLAGSNALNVISAPVVAPNGLSALCVTPYETGTGLRLNAATNNLVGSLVVGTPGNVSYTTPTGLYVDINGTSLNPMVLNLTNVTVCSNATFRISGANSGYTLSPFPQQITISGDGLNGLDGAWVVTGNGGGSIAANVVLAGDSTIDNNAGAANQTVTLDGVISGTGNLRFVSDNSAANRNFFALTNACTYVGNTTIAGETKLTLIGGNNRLPANTVLTLGATGCLNPLWNDSGRLVLGNPTNSVDQTLAGLNCPSGIANPCWVAGGNATNVSMLTVNNATNNYFAGSFGGSAAPANELALIANGPGNLTLTGTNGCVGGFTINGGTLTFGDGNSDWLISGPITNNSAVAFDTASSQTYGGVISGAGSVTELGYGALTLSGTNTYTGLTLVQSGKLLLTTASTGQGAVAATTGGEFDVALVPAAASLTNASLTLGASAYDSETLGFSLGLNSPGATAPLTVGTLTNTGNSYISILSSGPVSVGDFPLIKYSGYASNANSQFTLNAFSASVTAILSNNVANHSIDLVVLSTAAVVWTGATDTNWDYTTFNWLNPATLTATNYADGESVMFNDSGANTALNLNISPQPSSLVVSNAAKAYSFNGSSGIGGAALLLKQGSGTLTVAVNNNNTGGTAIENGTLQVGDGLSADGTITSPITDNGSLVFNVLNNDTSGGITGTGTVTKAGSGTLTLGSGSAYAGGTLVQAGRLYVTDSSALGTGTNGATVLTGSELWMDQAVLTIAQPLLIGGLGVNGTAGAFNVTAAASGSTWSGNIKATANPTVFSAAASTVTLSGGVNGGTNVLNFAPLTGGNFIVSSNLTAGQVVLNGLSGATAVGGLNLSGVNTTLTNAQVLLSVAPGASPPVTDGLWVNNNLALGTNCSVVLTNGQHIGDTGTRLGLASNVSIPAGVSLTAYCPGTGYEGVGGYRCTFSVMTSTTNTWNGPISLHGADPTLGSIGIFTLYGGSSGTSGRLVVNGNITVLDGMVTLVVRGAGSGQLNGQINLGTNAFATTDTALWTVCSQGNLWGLTTVGSGRSLQLGTNNALPTSTTVSFNLAAGTATGWDLNGFNQQVAGLANSGAYSAAEGIVENLSTNSDSTLTFNSATNVLFDGQLIGGTTRKLNLVVAGGTLELSSPLNSYAGSTTIAGGATLALVNDTSLSASLLGNITASTPIDVQAGGTFNVSGATNGGFTLGAGRTLQGNGTVNGSLSVSGTVAPGESIGTLTVTTNVTLGGTAWMAVNNTLGTNGLLNAGGTLTYRGILVITNVSGTAYTNNQVLKLFNAPSGQYTGAFTNIVFPGVTAYNTNNLVVNGTVQVISVIPPVNPNPTNITATVSNDNLNLFWPADHTGWRLLEQTNHLAAGISLNTNDWMTVAGSAATNQMFIPIVTTNQNEFYRLVYP